jgi:tetratricopeptide (TPR) repeat protein
MSPPLGIGLETWAIVIPIVIILIGSIWKFAHWKGGLDQWRGESTDWRNDVSTTLNDLQKNVILMMGDIEAIKTNLEKSIKNGMVGYHSPFVASPKAIEVLERISLLTEIDANYSRIVEKVNERSKLPIYSDIKGMERRFIEIAPGVIHELIRAGKIEEKKIDIAMDELGEIFKPSAASYYGVLLVITAYILEKERYKGYPADVSLVYSQIDAMGSDSPDELLETFGGDLDRVIESYETAVRTLGAIDADELAEKRLRLAFWCGKAGRKGEALEQLRAAIAHKPDYATAHSNLGNLLYDLKRYDEAEKEWRAAIRADPDHATAHSNLGNLLYDLKRYDGAEKEYREAMRADPDDAEAHANLGFLLSAIDRKEEAIQEFNTALNLKDQLPDKGERIIRALELLQTSHS